MKIRPKHYHQPQNQNEFANEEMPPRKWQILMEDERERKQYYKHKKSKREAEEEDENEYEVDMEAANVQTPYGRGDSRKSTPAGLGSRGGRGSGYGSTPHGAGPSIKGGYSAYPGYHSPPPAAYGHMPYDPYAGAYGDGPGYGTSYDMHGAGYPPVDPYYAPPVVPPYGGGLQRGKASAYGGGTIQRGCGGKPTGSSRTRGEQ